MSFTIAEVENNGERVSPAHKNHNYAMHIGVYEFAASRVKGKKVADIGSGSGYGSHFLTQSGATLVHGYEFDETAVAFARTTFKASNLQYSQTNFNLPLSSAHKYDMVFSSNVFEHLTDLRQAIKNVLSMLETNGEFVLAVPCIIEPSRLMMELKNPFHFANMSSLFWQRTLKKCFQDVTTYVQAIHCSRETYDGLCDEDKARKDPSFSTFVEIIGEPEFNNLSQLNFEYANVLYVCKRPTGTIDMADYSDCPVSSIRELSWRTDPCADWTPPLQTGDFVQRKLPIDGWIGGIEFFLGDCNRRGGGIGVAELKITPKNSPPHIRKMEFDIARLEDKQITPVHWAFYRQPVYIPPDAEVILSLRSFAHGNCVFNVAMGTPYDSDNNPFLVRIFKAIEPLPI